MDETQLLEAIGNLIDEKLQRSMDSLHTEFTDQMGSLKTELRSELTDQMGALQTNLVNQFNAIIETKVLPEIHLIAEQHGDIIQKLEKADEIDDVKDRVRNLERSVTAHTSQISELKKAQ